MGEHHQEILSIEKLRQYKTRVEERIEERETLRKVKEDKKKLSHNWGLK